MRCKVLLGIFFCLIIFGGCSIKETAKNGSDEDVIRERVMAYANYRITDDLVKSYEYEDQLFRKTTTMSQYIKRLSGGISKWLKADIKSLRIEGDKAFVDMNVRVKTTLMGVLPVPPQVIESDSVIKHLWVKQDGTWYHVFKAKGLYQGENAQNKAD